MSSLEFHISTYISQDQLVNYSHQENCQLITLYFECFLTMYPACISYQRIELKNKYQTINNEHSYLVAKMMTLLNVNISLETPDSSATNLLLKLNMHIPISSRRATKAMFRGCLPSYITAWSKMQWNQVVKFPALRMTLNPFLLQIISSHFSFDS